MTHSFSNCPLRSSSLFITDHTTQCIITATDEILDLLGYSLNEISGHSIKQLDLKLSSNFTTLIPECSIRHAKGNILQFQVCMHQDPLGGSSCLDYWLIKRVSPTLAQQQQKQQQQQQQQLQSCASSLSILKLSSYGTIEQAQLSSNFYQSTHELIGKPIMAYIYKDDVYPLCSNLSKLYSNNSSLDNPLCIRWSTLPCLYLQRDDTMEDYYDWISFSIIPSSSSNRMIKPVCILKPMGQQELVLQQQQQLTLLCQFTECCKDFMQHSKLYIQDFLHYLFIQLLSTLILKEDKENDEKTTDSFIWHLVKDNYITQCSLNVLEFTGLAKTLLK